MPRYDLLPYRVIDCPVQSIISEKVVAYLKLKSNFFSDKSFELWNKINTVDIIKAVPEIPTYFQTLGLKLREVAITVINQHKDAHLHIDELPVTAKINFPILNTTNTYNEWYKIPQHLLESEKPIINQFGAAYYNLENIDLAKCQKIGEYNMEKPIIFNSQIPHRIRISDEATLPRLVMPCTFFNEPLHFLVK